MTISELDLLSIEEKKNIIHNLPASKLLEDYDVWTRTFDPINYAHCETRDLIREEIISRMENR